MLLCVHQKKKLCIINISRKWCHCNIYNEKELSIKVYHSEWLNITKYNNRYCFPLSECITFGTYIGIGKMESEKNTLSLDFNMHLQWHKYNRWNTEKLLLCMIELQKNTQLCTTYIHILQNSIKFRPM